MNLPVTALSITLTAATPSLAVSHEGARVRERSHQSRFQLRNTSREGIAAVYAQLRRLEGECARSGWDGYGAEPVSSDAVRTAQRFVEALPLNVPVPSIGAEPDGHVTLEWHRERARTLSVSVTPDGGLHYAGLFGAASVYGTEPFMREVPRIIIDLIRRLGQG